ncbi:MAG: hypothetical protein WCT54_03285 [Patescibacteria group bacterium]
MDNAPHRPKSRPTGHLADVYNSEDAMNATATPIQVCVVDDQTADLDKLVRQAIWDIGKTGSITMRERRLLSNLAASNPDRGAAIARDLRVSARFWLADANVDEVKWFGTDPTDTGLKSTRRSVRSRRAYKFLHNLAYKLDDIAKEARQAA